MRLALGLGIRSAFTRLNFQIKRACVSPLNCSCPLPLPEGIRLNWLVERKADSSTDPCRHSCFLSHAHLPLCARHFFFIKPFQCVLHSFTAGLAHFEIQQGCQHRAKCGKHNIDRNKQKLICRPENVGSQAAWSKSFNHRNDDEADRCRNYNRRDELNEENQDNSAS